MAKRVYKGRYNDRAANLEGWAIFECSNGRYQIQRLDSPNEADESLPDEPMWASDAAAIRAVTRYARGGSLMHQAALRLHGTKIRGSK